MTLRDILVLHAAASQDIATGQVSLFLGLSGVFVCFDFDRKIIFFSKL